MKTVWLFRHAESQFNTRQHEYVGGRSNETPLSPKGIEQAERLGLWIARQKLVPDVVYASPARRTLDTGRLSLLAAKIRAPFTIDDRLQEMSQGEAEGMLRKSVYTKEVVKQIQTHLMSFKLPGGESMHDVADRGHEFAEEYLRDAQHQTSFVYTHGFWIRCVVGRYEGWNHADIRANDVDNASATKLVFLEGHDKPEVIFNIDTQTV